MGCRLAICISAYAGRMTFGVNADFDGCPTSTYSPTSTSGSADSEPIEPGRGGGHVETRKPAASRSGSASWLGRLPDVTESMTGRPAGRIATGSTLLALASGVVDLWAVTSLSGPFASVVTGNLVVAGGAVGRGDLTGAGLPLIAVLGFALGVATWSFAWRGRPTAVAGPLIAELVVLVALSVVWVRNSAAPPPGVVLALVGAAALAMGAQSATALRLGESTTYLTGTLTGGVVALVAGGPRARVAALRQLAGVFAGATAAALLLGIARPWVPVLAVVLLVAALVALGRPRVTSRV